MNKKKESGIFEWLEDYLTAEKMLASCKKETNPELYAKLIAAKANLDVLIDNALNQMIDKLG